MFDRFRNWYEKRHEYAKEWKKRTGGKVMGYFCTYVPEEILYAADILPVRILGSHEPQSLTEPYIFGMYCPFCRDCLAQGLKKRYDYLDGIMISQSCLHIRQAFTSWQMHIPVDYSYYLPMPHHVQSPRAVPFLAAELEAFKGSIEKWTGKKMTEEDLKRGIALMNENRRLLREVYGMRKAPRPPFNGLEAMYLSASAQMTDKRDHSEAMKHILPYIGCRESGRDGDARLMLIGSENDDTEFVKMVESCGATVVVDDHCTGSRYFWNEVEMNGHGPIEAIARRYIERPRCPTKDWPERSRLPHILGLAKDYGAQGAVALQQKFCDPHELDNPAILAHLKSHGIPGLALELDVTVPAGQFRTRVEAFLEMLGQEDLF